MKKRNLLFEKIVSLIERGGNALPHPSFLFAILSVLVLIFSFVGFHLTWKANNPIDGSEIYVNNLLTRDGLHQIISDLVKNYTDFAPLGIVLVAILGLSVAENSGLINALLRLAITRSNNKHITFWIVFAGVISNIASDIGYVLIIPLAGVIFHALGRHPLAGISAAFAGVSGGFSANLFIGTTDPLLAGISTEAARIIDPTYTVLPTANYYFMAASTFLICFIVTWINTKFIEPRLGYYNKTSLEVETIKPLSHTEIRALRWSLVVLIAWIIIFLIGLIPNEGIWRSSDNSVLKSPLFKHFVVILFLIATSTGITYGFITKTFKSSGDIIQSMHKGLQSIISFMIIVFFASQFVAWFKWSNLGMILAIRGAEFLTTMNLSTIPLIILFVLFSGFLNLFMGSASAKWALLAPIFIPMFMLINYSPELTQAIYRIGDSSTNIISPMMSFFALVITYFQRYDEKAGIGTVISTMLPHSIALILFWTLLLIAWILVGLPLGPDAESYYLTK